MILLKMSDIIKYMGAITPQNPEYIAFLKDHLKNHQVGPSDSDKLKWWLKTYYEKQR